MNSFYMCAIILTELMMIAMCVHVIHYSGFTKTQKTWYLLTFASTMLCAAAEFAVHCGVYDERFAPVLTVLTVLQFSVAPLLAVLFSGSLGLNKQGINAVFFLSVNVLIETIAAPFRLIFYFDETGYHRGEYFIIYTFLFVISLLYLIANMFLVGKKFRHRDTRTIVMIVVILIAGILPMAFLKLNITYVAIAIAASLCYIYYNDLVQQDIQAELVKNQKKLSVMQNHIISSLANLIENRDLETGEHVTRTSAFVKKLAEFAIEDGVYTDELNDSFVERMQTLAPLHDVGKIIVSDQILRKPGKLIKEEFEEMKKHAAAGGRIIEDVLQGVTDSSYTSFAADIATYHHERWDGTGYPEGLKGDKIPLSARIMAIADVFDALVSERCYKKAMTEEEAIKIIEEEAGSHFDPNLVAVFLKHRYEFHFDSV